jgi:serine protease AprX
MGSTLGGKKSWRRQGLWGLLMAALLSLVFVGAAPGDPGEEPGAGAPTEDVEPAASEPRVDRDGDKVFEDLEAELAGRAPSSEVDVIVQLRDPATARRVDGLETAIGGFALEDRFTVIDAFAATLTKVQVRALAAQREVTRIEEDARVHAFNSSAQSSFGITKARGDVPALDGDGDGSPSYSGGDLVAAVIDTGIDAAHPDLDEGKVLGFKDYVNGRTTPYDDNSHGTHVAGTIAGEGDNGNADGRGVAPAAGLVGVKVLNSAGSGTTSNVVAGIDWVVQNKDVYGIEAINLSLGSSGCGSDTASDSLAVNRANAAGIVVAVAAGNSGSGTCTVGTPGAATGALTVGAMADMGVNGFKQAYFSSRGKTADGRIKPDLSAPGVSITSAASGTTGYSTKSGTSMATPFVAGTALLMLDANPALTPGDVRSKMKSTAEDWGRGGDNKAAGSTGEDIDYGAGRLDGYAALRSAGAALSDPPAMPVHEVREGSLSGTGAQVDYQIDVTDTSFPIAATLIHPGVSGGSASSPDFDLYLFNPSGAQVASAETARRQDELGFKPTVSGTYTLRIKSYSGSGAYFVDLSAGTTPPSPDTTAPAVSLVSPADGATSVDRSTNVTVTFSEPMDKASVQSAFSLTRTSDGSPVSGTFSWSGNAMTFHPSADLDATTQYTARVAGGAGGAKDTAGNALASDATTSFTTGQTFVPATAAPTGVAIEPGGGTPRSGSQTHTRLAADDGSYYEVNSTTSGTRTSSWYGSFSGISNELRNLKVDYSGRNSRTCTQTVAIWRWTDSQWVQLDSRSVGTSEIKIANLAPGGTLGDYVSGEAGDGELRVRVRCTRSSGSFYARGDMMRVAFERP